MFIPPSDLLFCTVNELLSTEDEDAGSGSTSGPKEPDRDWSVLDVMRDL